MIFPESLPDETLAGLMARQARINGYSDCSDFIGALFRGHTADSFIDAVISIPLFCTVTENAYGTAEHVTRKLTHLYAQLLLGDLTLTALRDIESGNQNLRLGDLTFFGTTALSFCRSCISHDIAQHGFSYWHRLHQLPVTTCCSQHGDRLLRFTCKRSRLHSTFPLPADEEVQASVTNDLLLGNQSAIWSGISALACNLLADRSEPLESGIIREVFLDELRAKRLVTDSGRLRSAEFNAAFKLFFSNSPTEFDKPIHGVFGNPQQLLRGVTDFSSSPPFLRVILIYWLFGEWAAFKERCNWRRILGEALVSSVRQGVSGCVGRGGVNSDESAILLGHRQVCVDYAMEHPNPSRLEFLKNHYRSFRWLLHRDRSWLDAQLPVSPKQVVQLGLFE